MKLPDFTEKQNEVFELIKKGFTTEQIVKKIDVKFSAVEHRRSTILRKINKLNKTFYTTIQQFLNELKEKGESN